ncbi:MAG: TIM barrel protein [Pseudomonadota bacterium]
MTTTTFSANLGFLWTDRPLPDAIRAAARAGFDAVEFHWPYDVPVADMQAVLTDTGLPVLGLNTQRGDTGAGENGLAALPGREDDARAAIDEAISYAAATGTRCVHVMAGKAEGAAAEATFVANLTYAAAQAAPHGITVLIEPLNSYDAPGYFLSTTGQAMAIFEQVEATNLKLMFDCYHVQLMEGDLTTRIKNLLPKIGHFQFAGVPDRGPPDQGEVNYAHIFRTISGAGWTAPLGAEYKPGGDTDQSLGWMVSLRNP